MLILGHAGLTLGTAVLLSTILERGRSRTSKGAERTPEPEENLSTIDSALKALGRRVDLRLLLVGSLLPDIIDKPLGQIILRDVYNNGRIFSHTLLFIMALTACGLYRYRRRRGTGLLALGFGSLMHLIEDESWLNLQTLLWPLYGFSFVQLDLTQWVPDMIHGLFANPAVYVPELAGAVVLIWFAWRLWRSKKVYAFIRSGLA